METQKHGKELIDEAREEIKHAREALKRADELLGDHTHQVFIPDEETRAKGAHIHHRQTKDA